MDIASIDASVRSSSLHAMTGSQIRDAHEAVLCARDPAWFGDAPHLRVEVDPCGLDDDRLAVVEIALWRERERRDAARTALPLRMAA